jgi:hypothetical protein
MGLFSKDKGEPVVLRTGKELACVVCGCTRFFSREALLNTPGMTFLKLDWANATAHCRVCEDCGHILWFLGGD